MNSALNSTASNASGMIKSVNPRDLPKARKTTCNDSDSDLRENQAEGIVIELTDLLMKRFDVLRQGLWDGDSSTIFISEKLMQVPK